MEERGYELDPWRLIGVLLCKFKRELELTCSGTGERLLGFETHQSRLDRAHACLETRISCTTLPPGSSIGEWSPPSHGVSSGPDMTAFHCMMLVGLGDASSPARCSFFIFLKSLISRCRHRLGSAICQLHRALVLQYFMMSYFGTQRCNIHKQCGRDSRAYSPEVITTRCDGCFQHTSPYERKEITESSHPRTFLAGVDITLTGFNVSQR